MKSTTMYYRTLEEDLLLWERDGRASTASFRIFSTRVGGVQTGIRRRYPLNIARTMSSDMNCND